MRRLPANIDLAVLRRENQTETHVTPRIDSYAYGLFREQLCVVGPPPARPSGPSPTQVQEMRVRLLRLLEKASNGHRPIIEMRRGKRLKPRSVWMTEVEIDGEVFGVSLLVCFPANRSDVVLAR
jgi:DNA (cytosine-5)-methyltransferase 1